MRVWQPLDAEERRKRRDKKEAERRQRWVTDKLQDFFGELNGTDLSLYKKLSMPGSYNHILFCQCFYILIDLSQNMTILEKVLVLTL